MKKKRWYIDGREVPYKEYRQTLRAAYKHKLKIYILVYRLTELPLSVMNTALRKYFLDCKSSIVKGIVMNSAVVIGTAKDIANRFAELEDMADSPTYYDYRGKKIED